jgi:hypothetical protein
VSFEIWERGAERDDAPTTPGNESNDAGSPGKYKRRIIKRKSKVKSQTVCFYLWWSLVLSPNETRCIKLWRTRKLRGDPSEVPHQSG